MATHTAFRVSKETSFPGRGPWLVTFTASNGSKSFSWHRTRRQAEAWGAALTGAN